MASVQPVMNLISDTSCIFTFKIPNKTVPRQPKLTSMSKLNSCPGVLLTTKVIATAEEKKLLLKTNKT